MQDDFSFTQQQINGKLGEDNVAALLGADFWLLKRSVDIDGVDYLLQIPAPNMEDLRRRDSKIEVYGLLQAKFFTGRNSVAIARKYVEDKGKPRKGFFVILCNRNHARGYNHFFFTAEQVILEFRLDEKNGLYVFSLTNNRRFNEYKNIPQQLIVRTIRYNIEALQKEKNLDARLSFASAFQDANSDRDKDDQFTYHMVYVKGCPVVLVTSKSTSRTSLLDARRDLFPYTGGYTWGGRGTSANYLATCLLAHHFGDRAPTVGERCALVDHIISRLPFEDEHKITTEHVNGALKNSASGYAIEKPDGNFTPLQISQWLSSSDYKSACLKATGTRYVSLLKVFGYSTYLHTDDDVNFFIQDPEFVSNIVSASSCFGDPDTDLRISCFKNGYILSAAHRLMALGHLVRATSSVASSLMAERYLVRGGICEGLMYHDGNTVAGSGLDYARSIEVISAPYPRIIIADTIQEDAYGILQMFESSKRRDLSILVDYNGKRFLNTLAYIRDASDRLSDVNMRRKINLDLIRRSRIYADAENLRNWILKFEAEHEDNEQGRRLASWLKRYFNRSVDLVGEPDGLEVVRMHWISKL